MTHHRQRYAIAVWQLSTEAGPTRGVSLGVLLLAAEPMAPASDAACLTRCGLSRWWASWNWLRPFTKTTSCRSGSSCTDGRRLRWAFPSRRRQGCCTHGQGRSQHQIARTECYPHPVASVGGRARAADTRIRGRRAGQEPGMGCGFSNSHKIFQNNVLYSRSPTSHGSSILCSQTCGLMTQLIVETIGYGPQYLLKTSTARSIGVTGFEPATSCSQSRRSGQAELHPGKPVARGWHYTIGGRRDAIGRTLE